MATAEMWVTSEACTNPMATTTVVGATVIESGRLTEVRATVADGEAVVIRSGTVLLAFPAVPMAVVAAALTAGAGITSVPARNRA